jgi:hypothetical protein
MTQVRAQRSGYNERHGEDDAVDLRHGDVTWRALTRIPDKARLYGPEGYFREGFADARRVLARNMEVALRHSALLVIKPDALATGKARSIVELLHLHGFAIASVTRPSLTRLHWREMWRYQLSAATVDRLAVYDLILIGDMLALLLYHPGPLDVPATVWLSGLKGPSTISSQPPGCLRRRIAQPNRLFSCFHTADEPADLLRELAILFDHPIRDELMLKLLGGELSAMEDQLLEETLAASERGTHTFNVTTTIMQLEHAISKIHGPIAKQLRCDLERMHRGECIDWFRFTQALTALDVKLDRWDLALLGATFVLHDEPGASKLIESASIDRWR